MRIWPYKKRSPCHPNRYLQTAADARAHRDRFRLNPWAKVGSLFVPKPLRMSPGYPCCCGGGDGDPCTYCTTGSSPLQVELELSGFTNDVCGCSAINDTWVLTQDSPVACLGETVYCCWGYYTTEFCDSDPAGGLMIRFGLGSSELIADVAVTGSTCYPYQVQFTKTVTTPYNCSFSGGISLPTRFLYATGDCCTDSPETCTVYSV